MCCTCDTKVKGQAALTVHLGDAVSQLNKGPLGSLSYSSDQINRALERDASLGASVKEKFIREFNRPGATATKIQKGQDFICKRVTLIYLHFLPTNARKALKVYITSTYLHAQLQQWILVSN